MEEKQFKITQPEEQFKMRPLGNRVVVKQLPEEEERNGIIIPVQAQEKPQRGIVVAAGPGKFLVNDQFQPNLVSVGDEILFGRYSGSAITLDDEDYLVMRDEDILGIVEVEE